MALIKKKIIIFASLAPSLLNFRKELMQAFLDQGLQVYALAPSRGMTPEFREEFRQVFPSVVLLEVPMGAQGMNPVQDIKTLWALIRVFRNVHPDYVFSYTIKPVIYGSLAARCAGVPHIFSMMTGLASNFHLKSFKHRCLNFAIKLLYRLAFNFNQAAIFQNPDDQALFVRQGLVAKDKTFLVSGSGVDLDRFSVKLLPKEITFIFVGRLILDKGILEFIEAATEVKKQYPGVKFILLGGAVSGHPRALDPKCLSQAEQKGVVQYVPEVKDVRPYLAEASVLVLPSYREGTPRSCLEAMSMGRAVITTDAPGCRETVLDGVNGFLVPVKNSKALAEKMLLFIKQPELASKMGLEGRHFVERKFDVHQVNRRMLEIFNFDH